MKYLIVITILAASTATAAQTLTVKRVKGNQAIVEVRGARVETGQIISLPTDEDEFVSTTPRAGTPRNTVIGITSAYYKNGSSETVGAAKSSDWQLDLKGRYGWNSGTSEWGFIGILGMRDLGAGATNTYGGGGFFDWNLQPNKPGNDMVYGLGGDVTYQISNPAGGGTATNTWQLYPQGFLKWFIARSSAALRTSVGFDYNEATTGPSKVKNQYVRVEAGFAVYF